MAQVPGGLDKSNVYGLKCILNFNKTLGNTLYNASNINNTPPKPIKTSSQLSKLGEPFNKKYTNKKAPRSPLNNISENKYTMLSLV